MAQKQDSTNVSANDNENLQNARNFWSKYSKLVIFISLAIILAGGGYLGYKYLYKEPKEQKAKDLIFSAEKIFDKMASEGFTKDSVSLVLNGGTDVDTKVTGLLKIVKEYSSTTSANRANFMIGACYLHLKEFDKAIKYLKDFDGNGAHQIQSKAYLMIGHAYAEQNKKEDAFNYYKKAATVNSDDESVTPDALMVAGMYAETIGKSKEAIELYKKIKTDYPASQLAQSGDVDKYLARLGITE